MASLTEFKVSLKKKGNRKIDHTSVKDSQTAAELFRKILDSDTIEYQEEAIVLFLNRANEFIGFAKIGVGGTTGVVIDPKVLFSMALNANAQSILLCHNHPSSNLKPSDADKNLTAKIRQGAELLDMRLLDHIIIGGAKGYFSFADEGYL